MARSKIIILKGKKQFFADLDREVTIVKEKQFYLDDLSKDFGTVYGSIKKVDLKKSGIVTSSKGKDFHIFDAAFIDDYRRIRRLPQIIPLKDIGYIISKTGIGKDSIVVEGGTGSGALAIFLSRYCRKVYSYEIEKDHIEVAKENLKRLDIDNVIIKEQSMYEKIDEKDVDLVCLDLPAPWEALKNVLGALKIGGFVVSYSPTIIQAADFVNSLREVADFVHLKTVEVIEREWEIDKRKVRPVSKAIIHSGFISLGRKI